MPKKKKKKKQEDEGLVPRTPWWEKPSEEYEPHWAETFFSDEWTAQALKWELEAR
jgi:hypothetical protein